MAVAVKSVFNLFLNYSLDFVIHSFKNRLRNKILILYALIYSILLSEAKCENAFAYNLNAGKESILISGGGSVLGLSVLLYADKPLLSREYIENLNPKDVNSFDRTAIHQWSIPADNASDILRTTLISLPALLIMPELINGRYKNSLTLLCIYSEALLINGGLTLLAKNTFNRPRPYLYDNELPAEERLVQKEPFSSFYSGHTSFSFCSAVFISKVYSDLYPQSDWKYAVWGSLLAASTTAYLRYKAGKHYPTDILAGAIVGSAIGYLIPAIHKTKNSNVKISQALQSPLTLKVNFSF